MTHLVNRIAICAIATVLVACSTSGASTTNSSAMLPSNTRLTDGRPATTGYGAKTASTEVDVLYMTDGSNVKLVSYQYGIAMGSINHLQDPRGLCSDSAGNVFITNGAGQSIYEYAYAQVKRSASLQDKGAAPNGCSVDPTTGNLAVTNYCQGSIEACTGPGNVAVYKNAKVVPKLYSTNGLLMNPFFCGYDNASNLFVVGTNGTSNVVLAELAQGSRKFKRVKLNDALGTPGNVQWDGTYITVGDVTANAIHRYTVTDYDGTEAGVVQFDSDTAMGQTWIFNGVVFIPDQARKNVGTLRAAQYPRGGFAGPVRPGLRMPYGVTVSVP
jgi:hypothetical protein